MAEEIKIESQALPVNNLIRGSKYPLNINSSVTAAVIAEKINKDQLCDHVSFTLFNISSFWVTPAKFLMTDMLVSNTAIMSNKAATEIE